MDNNKKVQNDNDRKKITYVAIAILVLMITTTGATYAWLAIGATSANSMTGTVASAALNFQLGSSNNTTSGVPSQVAPVSPYASDPMVPQRDYYSSTNVLQKAVTGVHPTGVSGSTVYQCVDSNANVVCKVYTFTIRNNSTATAVVNGRIWFANAPTNLKWALMTSGTAVSVTASNTAGNVRSPKTAASCTTSTATSDNDCWFAISKSLVPSGGATLASAASGSYQQYWLVFWIHETEAVQTDSGTWTASIEFTSSDGKGITSTIVS